MFNLAIICSLTYYATLILDYFSLFNLWNFILSCTSLCALMHLNIFIIIIIIVYSLDAKPTTNKMNAFIIFP